MAKRGKKQARRPVDRLCSICSGEFQTTSTKKLIICPACTPRRHWEKEGKNVELDAPRPEDLEREALEKVNREEFERRLREGR